MYDSVAGGGDICASEVEPSGLPLGLSAPPPGPEVLYRLPTTAGGMPPDSPFYVVRPTDNDFLMALRRRESIVLVKGARQMGKTSLLARGLQQARKDQETKVIFTDFQKLNASSLKRIEDFYRALIQLIAFQLKLKVKPADIWSDDSAPNMNFEMFMCEHVLEASPVPIVWGMDEVDRLFTCDFAGDVFGMFRAWHNDRAANPTTPWQQLTLAIVYATEASLFIRDLNQSPFNVGTRFYLQDFTLDQVMELNRHYGEVFHIQPPLRRQGEIERFFQLLNGQPFLTHRGLQETLKHGWSMEQLEQEAVRDDGPFGDHLRRILVLLADDHEVENSVKDRSTQPAPDHCKLRDVVKGVLKGEPCPTPESFYRLRSAGIMTGKTDESGKLRCELYARYLEQHLLTAAERAAVRSRSA